MQIDRKRCIWAHHKILMTPLVTGTDHFTMNTHLRVFHQNKILELDVLLLTICEKWSAICAWYLHENNTTLKYCNTFVTVTSDRKEGKSGLLLATLPTGKAKINVLCMVNKFLCPTRSQQYGYNVYNLCHFIGHIQAAVKWSGFSGPIPDYSLRWPGAFTEVS